MSSKAQATADSGSEWGSDDEETVPQQVSTPVAGDESEDLGSSEEEEAEETEDSEDEEDEEAKAKAAAAEAKKKAKAKAEAKKKADAKKKGPSPSSQKAATGTPKKRKTEGGGEAPPKESAKPKKGESAEAKPVSKESSKPAKPKAIKPPEVFGGHPLEDGTRAGMTAQEEADTFMGYIKAEQEKQMTAIKNLVKSAFSDKGKHPKAMVLKCNGDLTTGHILSKNARILVSRHFEHAQTDLAMLKAAVAEFEDKTGYEVAVQVSLPGQAKRARND